MKDYHRIWLETHSSRTEEWLSEKLKDGFDIHHIDGDRCNNDPSNLILIEHRDHMMLHGNSPDFDRMKPRPPYTGDLVRGKKKAKRLELGKSSYSLRAKGFGWKDVGDLVYGSLEPDVQARRALSNAKEWATENNMRWPIQLDAAALHRIKPYGEDT